MDASEIKLQKKLMSSPLAFLQDSDRASANSIGHAENRALRTIGGSSGEQLPKMPRLLLHDRITPCPTANVF